MKKSHTVFWADYNDEKEMEALVCRHLFTVIFEDVNEIPKD